VAIVTVLTRVEEAALVPNHNPASRRVQHGRQALPHGVFTLVLVSGRHDRAEEGGRCKGRPRNGP
jgi:uncharacterized membrane protein